MMSILTIPFAILKNGEGLPLGLFQYIEVNSDPIRLITLFETTTFAVEEQPAAVTVSV